MARIFNGDTDVTSNPRYGSLDAPQSMARLVEVLNQWHDRHLADWIRGYVDTARALFALDKADPNKFIQNFNQREEKHAHIGAKYIRLDTGTSGAWMLEANTGDIFGIHAYGKVDRKKCAGNINDPTFDGAVLFKDRFRYGRFDNRGTK